MSQLVLRPKFLGCGVMSSVEGDLIADGCLFEIKAGDRSFRLVDLRQLLVYSALAYGGNALTFDRIGLFNPRTGLLWTRELDEVCKAISGLRSTDVFNLLLSHFMSDSTSN